MTRVPAIPFLLAPLLPGCSTPGTWIDEAKLVDMSHPFDESTIYWPTAAGFQLEAAARGHDEHGRWYASNDFAASEHGGTHLDAPIHFAEDKLSTAELPLASLVGPARVIDVRSACATDPDYTLAVADVLAHEHEFGRIEQGEVVLIHTGWSRFYPDRKRYLGDDRPGRTDALRFPGIGEAAAALLVERGVDLVGIDTASLDPGTSMIFEAHRVLAAANVPGLENVANLDLLPPKGATVLALPMKIGGGTGGPCRIVARGP